MAPKKSDSTPPGGKPAADPSSSSTSVDPGQLMASINALTSRLAQLEATQAPMPRRVLASSFSPGPFSLPYRPNAQGNVTRTYTKLNTSKQPTGFVRSDPNDPPEGLKGIKPADVPKYRGKDFQEFAKDFFNFMASYDPLLAEALLASRDEPTTKAHSMSTQRQALQLLKSALQPYQPAADVLLLVDSDSTLPSADAWHLVHSQFTRGVLFSLGTHLRKCTTPQHPNETALAYIHRLLLAREHCHSILPDSLSDDLMAVLILTGLSTAYSSTTDKLYANHLDTIPYIDEIRTMILLNQGMDQPSNPTAPATGSPSVLSTQGPKDLPKDPCFHCGNLGHWARNCPNPRDPAAFSKWKTDYLRRREARLKAKQETLDKPVVTLTSDPVATEEPEGNPTVTLTNVQQQDTAPTEYRYTDLFSPNPSVYMTTTYGKSVVGRDRTVRTPPAGALLDPGANVHAVADIDQLRHVQTIRTGPIVLEGISCQAHAVGLFVRTYRLNNGTDKTLTLPAYYVPDLPSRTTAGHRIIISQSALGRQYDAGLSLPRPSTGNPRVIDFPEGSLPVSLHAGLYFLPEGSSPPDSFDEYSQYFGLLTDMCSPSVVTTATAGNSETGALYHRRFGHASSESLLRQLRHFDNLGYTKDDVAALRFCDDCAVAKAKMAPRNTAGGTKPDRVFTKLSTDIFGPVQGPAGAPLYALGIIDHFSGYTWLRFLHSKGEVSTALDSILTSIRTIFNRRFPDTPWSCTLKADSEAVYTGAGTSEVCLRHQVDLRFTTPYSHHQLGRMERTWGILHGTAIALMTRSNVPRRLWTTAFSTAGVLRNLLHSPVCGTSGGSPYQEVHGVLPDLSVLREYGCAVYVTIPPEDQHKFEPKARRMVFAGYAENSPGYVVFNPSTNRFIISRHVRFDESTFPYLDSSGVPPTSLLSDGTSGTTAAVSAPVVPVGVSPSGGTPMSPNLPTDPRTIPEPQSYSEALSSPYASNWLDAIKSELTSLHQNDAFEITVLPAGARTCGTRWHFKLKFNKDGTLSRFKARFVVKGYTQVKDIDYDDIYSPVVKSASLRTILSIIAKHGWYGHQIDVDTAFLIADLQENVYIDIPEGLDEILDLQSTTRTPQPGSSRQVVRLKKNLYGLKQAPRNWFLTLHTWLENHGFSQSTADPCIYVLKDNLRHLLVSVYVDDLVLASPDLQQLENLKLDFKSSFPIKDLGNVSWLLGTSIDRHDNEIVMHQQQYIRNMLYRFGLQDCTPASTPMTTDFVLYPPENQYHTSPILDTEHRELYRKMIGSLHYAAWGTRPDIATAVNLLSRVQSSPTEAHLNATKRVFRYLKGSDHIGIAFPTTSTLSGLVGHADADWGTDKRTRRSTTGWRLSTCVACCLTSASRFLDPHPCTKTTQPVSRLLLRIFLLNVPNISTYSIIIPVSKYPRVLFKSSKYLPRTSLRIFLPRFSQVLHFILLPPGFSAPVFRTFILIHPAAAEWGCQYPTASVQLQLSSTLVCVDISRVSLMHSAYSQFTLLSTCS